MKMKEKLFFLILVILLSLPTIQPLLGPGYFPMHDDTQVGRVVAMGRSLQQGQFPVRWVADLGYGYGYPIFNFYGPLPYYLGGLLYTAGLDGLTATKFVMIVGMLLPVVTMYLFLAATVGVAAAVVGSLLYVYAPYHAVQLYVRGAVGELWTLGFYPLLGWGLLDSKARLLGSVGLAGIILTHTLLGYATVVFLVIGLVLYWFYQLAFRRFHSSLITHHSSLLLFGLTLSAFFWIPALAEVKFTDVASQVSESADFRDHFVCVGQLWNSLWGFGGSAPGCIDGMSFRLGKMQLVVAAATILLVMLRKQLPPVAKKLFGIGLLVTSVSLFLTFSVSAGVWSILPGFAYLQYPWRFLAGATFGLALMAASGFALLRSHLIPIAAAMVVILTVLVFHGKLFAPQYIIDRSAAAYETDEELRWRVSKISDEYLPPGLVKPKTADELPNSIAVSSESPVVVTDVRSWDTQASFSLIATKPTDVTINRAYFPGWRLWVNEREVTPRIISGLPHLALTAGQHIVELTFTDTPVRKLGNLLSAVALAGFSWILLRRKK